MLNDPSLPPASQQRRRLIDAIALLALALVGIVGYKLSPLNGPPVETRLAPAPGCNLHRGPCTVAVGGGSLEVSLTPRPVPLIKPIRIQVRATGFRPARMDADFAGVGMNMGFNRPQLQPQEDGSYLGETTLPVCVTGTMRWELTLLVATEAGHFLAPFRFDTPEGGDE